MSLTKIQRAVHYVQPKEGTVKVFVGLLKASPQTEAVFCSSASMVKAIEAEDTTLFSFKEDGLRWKGNMTNKVSHIEAFRFRIPHKWNEFLCNKQGLMADDQEQTIFRALQNSMTKWEVIGEKGSPEREKNQALLDLVLSAHNWEWTGHNHRRGVHDVYAVLPDGRDLWIEVKGIKGRVYYS